MARPVLETDWTSNTTGGSTADNITLTKPTGTNNGDLLIIIVGDDKDGSGHSYVTPSGWDVTAGSGNATSDAYLRFFTRNADGKEVSTINITRGCVSDEL